MPRVFVGSSSLHPRGGEEGDSDKQGKLVADEGEHGSGR
jgi:hypothetical protein